MSEIARGTAALVGAVMVAVAAGGGCAAPCPAVVAPVGVGPAVAAAEAARPEVVVVGRLGGTAEHVAVVVERREGLVAVRYVDGLTEWVAPEAARPASALVGRQADALLAGPGAAATVVSVTEVAGDLVHVTLPGEGQGWIGAALLGRVHPAPTPADQQATATDAAAPPAPPPRQPVDPRLIRASAVVTVMYSGSPYLARVQVPGRSRVYVHWIADGGEEWVAASDVVRVYPPVAEAAMAVGARLWYAGSAGLSDGVVAERRSGFARMIVVDGDPPGEWIERSAVVAALEPVPRDRLEPGAHVGVMSSGSLAGGVVEGEPQGGQIVLRWDDGSQESEASLSDVVELW